MPMKIGSKIITDLRVILSRLEKLYRNDDRQILEFAEFISKLATKIETSEEA